MANTFYLGTYWSPNHGRQVIDVDSLTNNYNDTVKIFHRDLNAVYITDAGLNNASIEDQMQTLVDNDCDIIHITEAELPRLKAKIDEYLKSDQK